MKKPETTDNRITRSVILRRIAALAAIAAAIVFYLFVAGDFCPVYRTFHFPCPGCGMTRAWMCIFRGDVAAASQYHPMWWEAPLLVGFIGVYIFDKKAAPKRRKAEEIILAVLCVMLIACYLWRIINGWRG